ncbi:MAG TPA: hypothetical protein VFI25_00035 [Planctomycetota bacterium]|nr:hypothetical protein [Planctomycetota bacterium]
MGADPADSPPSRTRLARVVLTTFLFAFLSSRILVFLIMSRRIPDLYLRLGGTHVHHLNHGIFLLTAVGAWLLFGRPGGRGLRVAAVLYGVGAALTFDEFGMWLHLGGPYWQRASFDAVAVLASLFGAIAFAPPWRTFRARHWLATAGLLLAVLAFSLLLVESFDYAGRTVAPRLIDVERNAPR